MLSFLEVKYILNQLETHSELKNGLPDGHLRDVPDPCMKSRADPDGAGRARRFLGLRSAWLTPELLQG